MCRVPGAGGALRPPRSLALRLRWIGDQLEKRRAAEHRKPAGRSSIIPVKSLQLMCTAIQVTVLILFVRKRHL